MNLPIEKSPIASSGMAKKPESQTLQAPSGFAKQLSNYPSFMDGLLKMICHPFVLLGGIMVAIYFFYKAWQSGNGNHPENAKLREANKDLLSEIKALRQENKNLRKQLDLLPDQDDYDYPARGRKPLTSGKRKVSVARLE